MKYVYYTGLFLLFFIKPGYSLELISQSSDGDKADRFSYSAAVNSNGRYALFSTRADNLVPDDNNGVIQDLFIRDRKNRTTERVSVSTSGEEGNGDSTVGVISADGRYVAFTSTANNLAGKVTRHYSNVYLRDRITGQTHLISQSRGGYRANGHSTIHSMNADGRYLVFRSEASNLVANDTNNKADLFIHDRITKKSKRISFLPSLEIAIRRLGKASISDDGTLLAFDASVLNLMPTDTYNEWDVFVHNITTGVTKRISIPLDAKHSSNKFASRYPVISSDGRYVTFSSWARNLVPDDLNGEGHVYIYDLLGETTEIISLSSNGAKGNGWSRVSSISDDNRFVAFSSNATNLIDEDDNGKTDAFVHDRVNGLTKAISLRSNGRIRDNFSYHTAISGDGRSVLLTSDSVSFIGNQKIEDIYNNIPVVITPTVSANLVDYRRTYIATFTNTSDKKLENCRAKANNAVIKGQRQFNFFTWPLGVTNPQANSGIDIEVGESAKMQLVVIPRIAFRKEIIFEYECDGKKAITIPFVNTVHLTAKTSPLAREDYIVLYNENDKTDLEIYLNSSKYWSTYTVKVVNAILRPATVTLNTTSSISRKLLARARICEIDASTQLCAQPAAEQVQLEFTPNQPKYVRVFVHAKKPIMQRLKANRLYLEARDNAGEIVAKNGIGIYTID